ncbi:hypothetical protein DM860_016979 [Cuscuta australis]|uniref:DUF7866 domain-containing protein n=1 Tax=Cuscuta australis TaxID=267555 RepID=A0A328DNI0_9ASTE|nr:hypothetical protein DM860_016979 [Cuscuta australis]
MSTLLVLFIFPLVLFAGSGCGGEEGALVLVTPPAMELMMRHAVGGDDDYGERRRLAPFGTCQTCTCCRSPTDRSTCSDVPCCYALKCNLPNKPSGTCAFAPVACHCDSCG